jgi:hypothetical protein
MAMTAIERIERVQLEMASSAQRNSALADVIGGER